MRYKNFRAALVAVGRNDPERCRALGLNPRTLTRYKAGMLPPPIPQFMRRPELLTALAQDAAEELKAAEAEAPARQVA
jgi:hypothetical protein